ncbi:MAG: hypothetical protein ABWK53_06415 [Anaerolineales bacterium]
MQTDQGQLPPPPGLIASLAAGFEAVANHITLIALPILLDLFLWLGPRLRLKELLRPFIESIPLMPVPAAPNLPELSTVQQAWFDFAERFNLFALLRTYPVGTSSLLSLEMPTVSPLGAPPALDAGPFLPALGWSLALTLLGLVLGAVYFYAVSRAALKHQHDAHPRLGHAIGQVVLLSLVWWALIVALVFPLAMFIAAIGLLNPAIAQIGLMILALTLAWLVLPIFFSPHGIYTFRQNAILAILSSLRMVRFTLPASGLFVALMLLISQGLRFLWLTPPPDSWWLLVGIGGHAFISTALLAASFIYYRDVNTWLEVVFERLKTQTHSAKI